VSDQMEKLRAVARLGDLPQELLMLLATVTDAELERLEVLASCWPPERGEIPWAAVRRCLDRPEAGR
jgi:hypothetical protein